MFDLLIGMCQRLQDTVYSSGIPLVYFEILLAGLASILILPWFRIFRRAGLSPGLGILMFIPLINIFVFLMFACREWPIERENRTPDRSALSRM